jgi:hypothetical protein
MAGLIELATAVVDEFCLMQTSDWQERPEEKNQIPGWYSEPDGRGILVSQRLWSALQAVSDLLRDNRKDLADVQTHKEWEKVAHRAMAMALLEIDVDGDSTVAAEHVCAAAYEATKTYVASWKPSEQAFPCSLFNEPGRPYPDFGVVRFETREVWLERKRASGEITAVTARRIARNWAGQQPRRLRTRHRESHERGILAAFDKAPYVCIVQTEGLAPEAAQQKAVMAARLSLLGVALAFALPANALRDFRLTYDGPFYRRQTLVSVDGWLSITRSKVGNPNGAWAEADAWAAMMPGYDVVFAVIGEVLRFLVSPAITARPDICRMLFHAMLFYHEACREPLDLIAVAKFGAGLDALALGKGENGILAFCQARRGWPNNQILPLRGHPTLKAAVERIYNKGRSRTLHGSNDAIGQDWSNVRLWAEFLGRQMLLTALQWVGDHPDVTNPKAFLVPSPVDEGDA